MTTQEAILRQQEAILRQEGVINELAKSIREAEQAQDTVKVIVLDYAIKDARQVLLYIEGKE